MMSGTEKETTARRTVAARVMRKPGVAGLIKLLMLRMGEKRKRGGAETERDVRMAVHTASTQRSLR